MNRHWPLLFLLLFSLSNAAPLADTNAQMGLIDELQDQVEGLRNDLKVIENKQESGAAVFRLDGEINAVMSNKGDDRLTATPRFSYIIDRNDYRFAMGIVGCDTPSSSLQPNLLFEGSADYALPQVGNLTTALSVGPREQINSLGQVIDLPGSRLRIAPANVPVWFSMDRLPAGHSVLAVGTGLQLSALDDLIDLNWQKRYGESQNSDILGMSVKIGSNQFTGRFTLGFDHSSTALTWTCDSIAGSQLTLKTLALGAAGVSPVLGDSHKEAGAIDVLGFPIENETTYASVSFDKLFSDWGFAVDLKNLNSQQTVKSKLSNTIALSDKTSILHEIWLTNAPTGTDYRALIGLKLFL